MIKPTSLFFILTLLALLIMSSIANGQDPADSWQIPAIECSEHCTTNLTIDGEGNLYLYVKRTSPNLENKLYIIQYGTSQITELNLIQIFSQNWGLNTHFVPISDRAVVVFQYQIPNGDPLVLLNPESETAISLNTNIPGQIEECSARPLASESKSIFRIGQNGVLFCSRDQESSFLHLAYLEDNQLRVEHTLELGNSLNTGSSYKPSWRYISGGLDGNIYIIPQPNTSLVDQYAPQYADSYNGSDYLVLRYDPDLETWSTIIISNNEERWQEREGRSQFAPFVGVDEDSNLYFWHNSAEGSDLVKYNPQGEKVWHLTELDFILRPFSWPLLLSNNRFILDFGEGELRYLLHEEITAVYLTDSNGEIIGPLEDGMVINRGELPPDTMIQAQTFSGVVGSVMFDLNREKVSVVGDHPYSILLPESGTYTLRIVPFSEPHAEGEIGAEWVVTFQIIDG